MPAYNTIAPPALYPGDSYKILDAEASTSITTSQQVVLGSDVGTGRQSCVVEGFFSADPGVFSIAIQFADTDSENYYIAPTTGGTINAVDSNYHFSYQYDAPGTLGQFVRAKKTTITNAVNLTVKITR